LGRDTASMVAIVPVSVYAKELHHVAEPGSLMDTMSSESERRGGPELVVKDDAVRPAEAEPFDVLRGDSLALGAVWPRPPSYM
jgi:hypothetical protein